MPGGHPVRKAVFDDQADGQGHHPVRVVGLRQAQIVHVGIEIDIALGTAMLRVRDVNIARAPGERRSQIMERPLGAPEPIAPPPAPRTAAPAVIAAPSDGLRLGKIFNTRDAFRAVRNVLARLRHDDALQRPLGLWNHR